LTSALFGGEWSASRPWRAYEEGRSVGWDEVRILEIESNSWFMKYKELAHMASLSNAIGQTSVCSAYQQ
jgi:hypothetical protein